MPYSKNSELPSSVRKALPAAAQTLFRKVFNSAYKKYADIVAFKVAWAAVKRKFVKKENKWIGK